MDGERTTYDILAVRILLHLIFPHLNTLELCSKEHDCNR